jgi:hypothetical protein
MSDTERSVAFGQIVTKKVKKIVADEEEEIEVKVIEGIGR